MQRACSHCSRIVVRGDDAGSARSANLAIAECVQRGILRNISVLACGPEVGHAAELLAGLPGVAFGCHAAINAEWDFPRWGPVRPTAAVPSLVDGSGFFRRTPHESHSRGAVVAEIMDELAAQVARLRQLGFRLTYLDFHMVFQWIPGLQEAVTRFCASERLLDADRLGLVPPWARLSSPPADPRVHLLAGLDRLPAGDYRVVTHPCCDDDEMRRFHRTVDGVRESGIGAARDRDRAMLTDPAVRAAMAAAEAVSVTFDEWATQPDGADA